MILAAFRITAIRHSIDQPRYCKLARGANARKLMVPMLAVVAGEADDPEEKYREGRLSILIRSTCGARRVLEYPFRFP